MKSFLLGAVIGFVTASVIISLVLVSLNISDTTTGQLRTDQPQNFLTVAATAAAKNAPGSDSCTLDGEFERFMAEFADRINTDRDPTTTRHSQIRQLWRRYNPDSMLRPEGYELYDLITPDYIRCTGQQPPHIERLPQDHVRHTCHYQDGNNLERKQVVGPRQINIVEFCDKATK